jgi:hypothetical protein
LTSRIVKRGRDNGALAYRPIADYASLNFPPKLGPTQATLVEKIAVRFWLC